MSRTPPPRSAQALAEPAPGDLTERMLATPVWSDELVGESGIPVVDVPFVTIGGGMGSFAMVDVLRIAGVPATDIAVLTTADTPWENYAYLTGVSQLPPHYRIRSDASSMPDNIWGFPSYAARRAFRSRSITGFVKPFWNVLTENVLSDYWTPLAGEVFDGISKEADRIGYWGMRAKGRARMVRKREGGGYFAILTPDEGPKRIAFRCKFAHLAVGYPSIRFLPELQEYRTRTGDAYRFVNAYEPHEHVYQDLVGKPGTVLVRGGGIAASAILNRIFLDRREHGARTRVQHVLRTYVTGPHGPHPMMRRRGGGGWAHQGFNWPKAAWGGQLKMRMEKLEGEERKQLWDLIGGSTTPIRRAWRRDLCEAEAAGAYASFEGEIERVDPAPGGVVALIRDGSGGLREVPASFVVDATGLVGDLREHRLLDDLVSVTGAGRNLHGRLDVTPHFELRGCRSGDGRMFAAGAATEGAYYAPADSLLGMQYTALRVADELAEAGFCGRIGSLRSMAQWVRYMRGVAP